MERDPPALSGRSLGLLALPTFGLAFAMSALTTYGPAVLARLTSSETKIGLLIGGEGAFALALPVVVGALSDRLPPSPLGRMTLPTALALTVSPPGREGAVAGLQDLSRGLGIVCGPILVGAAIDLSKGLLPATHGFAAMWLVVGLPILASLPFVRALERETPSERLP